MESEERYDKSSGAILFKETKSSKLQRDTIKSLLDRVDKLEKEVASLKKAQKKSDK